MKTNNETFDLNRREFIKGSSISTMMMLMGGVPLFAEDKDKAKAAEAKEDSAGTTVKCAVIGCGIWGREILKTLATLPSAEVVGICDTAQAFLRRAAEAAPKAEKYTDYRKVLENKDVLAIVVATPTHLHREVVEAALKAGKHVYCEAPMAHTVEDARAIAQAAKEANKQLFQIGQQARSDPQRIDLLRFVRAGAMGTTVMARAQWHKKQQWRRPGPSPERENELNWRLQKDISLGLIGEIGIGQVDAASWFLNARPVSVTGFGSVVFWQDGREVADTVQVVFEYPRGVNFMHTSTLANSFDADYEMYYGTDAAIMLRDNKSWMFKEVDAPLLGWEVYARKDAFYKETGIYLVANATKLAAQGDKPLDENPHKSTPLYYALEAFLTNTDTLNIAVEDFRANYNEADQKAYAAYLVGIKKSFLPAAGYKEGLEAAVTVIKANEAVMKGEKVKFQKEWFDV